MMDRGEILEGARPQNEAYEGLKHQILSLDIEPGEMLSESILSSQMNVGRPLMRDALAQLAEEGYVMVYPQKGTAVTMIDPERVRQAVHTHIVLEQAVLAEACQQGLTGAQLEYLECILEEQKRRGDDAVKRMILERQMSNALAAFCGKKYMLDVFRTMDCDMPALQYIWFPCADVSALKLGIYPGRGKDAGRQSEKKGYRCRMAALFQPFQNGSSPHGFAQGNLSTVLFRMKGSGQ